MSRKEGWENLPKVNEYLYGEDLSDKSPLHRIHAIDMARGGSTLNQIMGDPKWKEFQDRFAKVTSAASYQDFLDMMKNDTATFRGSRL